MAPRTLLLRLITLGLALAIPLSATPAFANGNLGGEDLSKSGIRVGAPLDPEVPVPALPKIGAQSWLIADLETGEVLASRNAHQKLPPASTIKALTALTLLPRLNPTATTRVDMRSAGTYGTRVGIVSGRRYSHDALFHALLLHSGNDAALALAYASGGVVKTSALMSAEAKRIQALNTVPRSPHGLDTPGQVSTAYDLALIAREGLRRSDFSKYVRTWSYKFPNVGKSGTARTIYNQNGLLKSYKGSLGVKTGYTTQARNTFIGAASRDGRSIVVTLMKLPYGYGRDKTAQAMLDWGFAAAGKVEPVGVLVEPVKPAAALKTKNVSSVVPLEGAITNSSSDGGSGGIPGVVQFVLFVLLTLAALRTRVLIRQHLRRRRRQARSPLRTSHA
jgi:serine-type D-Ala-D-Ala carboxypeptidase (penicillin-binding protein 5/6)